ncbi:MAG: hypothetical protein LBM27_05815 [Lactobacillaceae bacterium]|jgi:protein-tyrosine phosphatase|nr:hypothetical protein [Lactobacillaceae bacterium]
MIDIHTHLLPVIDTGTKTKGDAIQLARALSNQGITEAISTPRFHVSGTVTDTVEILDAVNKFQDTIDRAGFALKVYPGQETLVSEEIFNQILNDKVIGLNNNLKYILVYFEDDKPGFDYIDTFKKFQASGIRPVIAHPERNRSFKTSPELLGRFIDLGAVVQIQAGSLLGQFGKGIQNLATDFIKYGYAHVIASEAFRVEDSRRTVKSAVAFVNKLKIKEGVNYFEDNAQKIVDGQDIVSRDYQVIPEKRIRDYLI